MVAIEGERRERSEVLGKKGIGTAESRMNTRKTTLEKGVENEPTQIFICFIK